MGLIEDDEKEGEVKRKRGKERREERRKNNLKFYGRISTNIKRSVW